MKIRWTPNANFKLTMKHKNLSMYISDYCFGLVIDKDLVDKVHC